MSASVKFDNNEIVSNVYVPRYIKHESVALRHLTILPLTKEDGEVLVSEKYGQKRVFIVGNIKASSQTSLETAIDSFKELFSRKERNLDISWAGSTRRYVATCDKHEFNRDYMHLLFVPWAAEFVVASGIGEDTSETTLETGSFAAGAASKNGSWTFAGSARPRPRIRLRATAAATDPKGVKIENADTDEDIIITRAAGIEANTNFEVDFRLKTVTYGGTAIAFHKVFPTWQPGSNNYNLYIGEMVDQICVGGTNEYLIHGNNYGAMSFSVPESDSTYEKISVYVRKLGTPVADLLIRVETDNNGEPSGTLVDANAVGTIAIATVTTSWALQSTYTTAAFSLSANTKYWIVLTQQGAGNAANCYKWGYATGTSATYKRGNKATTDDAGVTWTDAATEDFGLYVYYGGKNDLTKTYQYDVYYYKRYL